MFSGYLMAAVYHLDGVNGFKGWQWYAIAPIPQISLTDSFRLFIIDGVISLPVAIAGFWLIPDIPETSRIWYLTSAEIACAQRRMELEGRALRSKYTIAKVKRIVTSWHIYALTLVYM